MEVHFCYEPLPVHTPFHATPAREKLLLGAIGAGKTQALAADAISLGLTQPAITSQIKRLQAMMGRPVFEKHAGGVRLNETGLMMLICLTAALLFGGSLGIRSDPGHGTEVRVELPCA